MENFGTVIEEMVSRVTIENKTLWERKLRLHIKPKPSWIPDALWWEIVNLVVHQTVETK